MKITVIVAKVRTWLVHNAPAEIVDWRRATGNGPDTSNVRVQMNVRTLNRQRKQHLKSLKLRREQLLREVELTTRDLKTLERQESQGYLHPEITFDSALDWGNPITLRGSAAARQYLDKVNFTLSAVAVLIERDTLGSDAELPGPGWEVSVVSA